MKLGRLLTGFLTCSQISAGTEKARIKFFVTATLSSVTWWRLVFWCEEVVSPT